MSVILERPKVETFLNFILHRFLSETFLYRIGFSFFKLTSKEAKQISPSNQLSYKSVYYQKLFQDNNPMKN